ncbi:MAG: hypothetical protein K8S94_07085, partial [Planctomycetia bacterium]|nr:hypothetical protein [Planctomycetia bacterium]
MKQIFLAALVAVAGLAPSSSFADGPGDNLPGSVRPIPPVGLELDDATKRRLLDAAETLAREAADVTDAADADHAEVAVFPRAVQLAVEDRFLYAAKEVEQAERLLALGRERLAALRAGARGARLVVAGEARATEPRLAVG